MPVDEYVTQAPVLPLRGVVAPYTGYRQHGLVPAVHRGLPSPYITLVFTLHDELRIARHADPAQAPGRFDSLVGGLHTTPVFIEHDGAQSGVQVSLDPLWARQVFRMPAGELRDIDVHAADLLGGSAEQLSDALRAAPDWATRFDVLDRTLLTLLDGFTRPVGVPDEVRHVWTRLRRSRGLTPIGCLADETGWSDRHLAAKFRHETGLTPKTAARVIRFDRARRTMQRAPATTLADLAVAAGYYDQSHLVRDFRDLTGLPPTKWLETEQPAIHD